MNKLAIASIAALAMTAAPAAMAEADTYVSLGYSMYSDDDATLGAGTARFGAFFNEYFGLEGEASVGFDSDDITDAGTGVTVNVDLGYQVGGFGVVRFQPVEKLTFMGRAGYSMMRIRGSSGPVSETFDIDGFAAGLGAQLQVTDRFAIRGDYTRFEADDDVIDGGLNTFTISAVLTLNGN